jgi:hypothetical protein|tara:strand:- start:424 stop:870 length:447 start_codon:yes stop_codon:yes gene_type:complete
METCSICLDEIHENERYELLRCSHVYHKKCILQWLEKSNTCPECRQIIPNIFTIETKNYGFKEKNILEIDYLHLKVYDRDFDKLKFKILIGNIYNVLIMCNKLIVKYYYGNKNKIKNKNLFFKDQHYSIIFYRLLQNVHEHFLNRYIE